MKHILDWDLLDWVVFAIFVMGIVEAGYLQTLRHP